MKRIPVSVAAVVLLASTVAWSQGTDGPKIGVFDPGRVSEETNVGKQVAARLSALNDKKVGEIQAKEKLVNEMQTQLTSQGLSLSPEKRTQLEKDIQKAALELTQAREAARNELQLEVAEAQNQFQVQLLQVVEQFGREEGFDVILVNEPALIPFHSNGLDITTVIVDRFNKIFPGAGNTPPAAEAPPAKKD